MHGYTMYDILVPCIYVKRYTMYIHGYTTYILGGYTWLDSDSDSARSARDQPVTRDHAGRRAATVTDHDDRLGTAAALWSRPAASESLWHGGPGRARVQVA